MGSKERRERERLQLREAICAAAREIAAAEGWQAVTMRKIAQRIEYSPPMIYEHFGGKEALLLDLMREGFRLLLLDMRGASAGAATPEASMLAMAQAYWDFAWKRPELYQVMHGLGGAPFCSGEPFPEMEEVFAAAMEAIHSIERLRDVPAPAIASLVDMIWATLHGFIALVMAERIERDQAAALARRATAILLEAAPATLV